MLFESQLYKRKKIHKKDIKSPFGIILDKRQKMAGKKEARYL